MNRYQKIAWFNLIVIALTIIITAMAIAIEMRIRGYSTVGWLFIGIMALLQYNTRFFKKPQGEDKVIHDERDSLILNKALSLSLVVFWYVFVFSCLLLFFLIGPKNSVPTITIPLIAFGACLFLKIACSVAIIVLYGRGAKDGAH